MLHWVPASAAGSGAALGGHANMDFSGEALWAELYLGLFVPTMEPEHTPQTSRPLHPPSLSKRLLGACLTPGPVQGKEI